MSMKSNFLGKKDNVPKIYIRMKIHSRQRRKEK